MALPAGPSSPPVVQTGKWLFRPIEFMDACRRKHGNEFSVMFLGFETPMVMISDPAAIKALYAGRENGLPPGRTVTLEPVMGSRSVLLLEGGEHLSRRKAMLPAFHGERMRNYESLITEVARSEISSWPRGSRFTIHPQMQALTLEVILRAVFGITDPARLERMRVVLARMLDDLASPRLQMRVLLSRRFGRSDPMEDVRQQGKAADELIQAEIDERRADPDTERDDILSMLMAAEFTEIESRGQTPRNGSAPSDAESKPRGLTPNDLHMGDTELRDQLITLLLAGHETTATALAWAFDLLLRHPQAIDRLRGELATGDETYLRAVISESLRLRPVVPLAGRRLSAELQVGDYLLPEGTDVTPAIWLAHTNPDSYPDPLEFRPERFLEDSPETFAWVPFGGGVRRCIGAAFAEFEMRIVLREVLTSCDISLADSKPERIARRNITFSPRRGTPVTVAPL